MKYCKRCVNPDTRPNIHFDENGVCPVCQYGDNRKKNIIDWNVRRKELEEIAEWGKGRSKSSYDCIIPVSGGKDSTRQALYIRDELKLKPLLVSCVYPPEQLQDRGAHNLSNLISLGFDTISVSLNPQVWKKLMREAFFKFANWCKSTELALYSIPIHFSIGYNIPLAFLGENPTYTIGESEGSQTGDATHMKQCNTLAGGNADHFLIDGVGHKDLYFYNYPPDKDMERAQVRIVYLGYYIEDFNSFKNAEIAIANGLLIRDEPTEDIGDYTGTQSLDEDFVIPNQMIKYIKFGFGQVTDKACEAVALGYMDRKEAVELVKKYDGKCAPKYIHKFCNYLDITEEQFWEVVESYRDRNIWELDDNGEWRLKTVLE